MRLSTAIGGFRYANLGKRNLGYIGWVGHGNLGDEALFQSFRDVLFPGAQVLLYKKSSCADWLERLVGDLYQGVVLGGGTLINRLDTAHVRHALDHGYKVYVFGTGVANPEFWDRKGHNSMQQWIPVLQRCASVFVRGETSRSILARHDVPATAIGDPALALAEQKADRSPGSRPLLGVNLRGGGNIWGDDETEVRQHIAQSCLRLLRQGWRVDVFPLWERDETVCAELVNDLDSDRCRLYSIDYHHPEQFMQRAAGCTAFLGMRLHSIVLAHCRGVPAIMIEYRPKCREYMKFMDQECQTFRTDRLDARTIHNRILELADDRNSLSQHITQRALEVRDNLLNMAEQTARMMGIGG